MSRYRSILCCFAVITGAFLAADVASAQTTWRVDDNAPGDPAPGDPSISDPLEDGSDAHPFDAIQEAIDLAVAGDEVLIADGTYTGLGNKNLDFAGKAITVHSENGADDCIIDCEDEGRGFYFHSGEGPDSVVERLTITNGYAPSFTGGGGIWIESSSPSIYGCIITGNSAYRNGGGIYIANARPTITDCTISLNSAGAAGGPGRGGGVYLWAVDQATPLSGCIITGNSATDKGGGVYLEGVHDSPIAECVIANNHAHDGGGVFCDYGDFEIVGCSIGSNSAAQNGAGVYLGGAHVTLNNCTVADNTAVNYGGGVYCKDYSHYAEPTIIACTVTRNSAHLGGGVMCDYRSGLTITDSTISQNTADNGGGVYCWGRTSPIITNCAIEGNHANVFGGGLRCSEHRSNPTLTNCSIRGNSAGEAGGGVNCWSGNPTFNNCIIADNSAELLAGGVGCSLTSGTVSKPSFNNCTIASNSAPDCEGLYCDGATVGLANSILWDIQPVEVCVLSGSVSMNHSDIQGGWPGDGNIDADPLFIDPDGPDNDPNTWEDNNYRLAAGSPCIDAGCNCAAPRDLADLDVDGDTNEYAPFDLDGEGRFFDDPATADTGSGPPPVIDMGAYEFGDADPQPIFGDFNGDGAVNLDDLAILLANYGTPTRADGADGDLYCDGDVSLSDLGAFLAAYAAAQP